MEFLPCYGVIVYKNHLLKWLPKGQVIAVADESTVLDGALHALKLLLNLLVK